MIPVVLVLGLAIGRWWAIPVLSVGWAALLLADDVCDLACSPGAATLAAANAALGVLVHKAIAVAARRRTASEPPRLR